MAWFLRKCGPAARIFGLRTIHKPPQPCNGISGDAAQESPFQQQRGAGQFGMEPCRASPASQGKAPAGRFAAIVRCTIFLPPPS